MAKYQIMKNIISLLFMLISTLSSAQEESRGRARDFGIEPGILTPGKWNAITDVKGVAVGHTTLIKGDSIRTGVTVVLPHQGNIFQEKVPAAVFVGNGFGKAIGFTQIEELGNIETPIALTNTLNSWIVANSLVDYTLSLPENSSVRSVNPVVGETNDGWLNDIRGRHVHKEHVLSAIENAKTGTVEEGSIGAGAGTRALGFKGGIGTSSRVLPENKGGYTIGVLVQTNFGGILTINGAPVGEELNNYYMAEDVPYVVDGSCMIIIATDAPLSGRNLERLAKRSFLAFGKVGSFSSNGSGDYSIAFSTHPDLRIPYQTKDNEVTIPQLRNDEMSPLFLAVVEATEEAIYNSLFMATTVKGQKGRTMKALPIKETMEILKKYSVLNNNK
jgi:D-aminopeptidase